MQKIAGTGILLKHDEARVIRIQELGFHFWQPDFQVNLRQIGHCGRFFPEAILPNGKDGDVVFRLIRHGKECLAHSRGLHDRNLPPAEYKAFVDAIKGIRSAAEAKPGKRIIYDNIRLPDPDAEASRYRLTGPFWNRRLSVLWGYESVTPDGQTVKGLAINDALRKLNRHVDRFHRLKLYLNFLGRLLLLALITAVLCLGWLYGKDAYDERQAELAAIPRCTICQEVLVDGLCTNICFNCGIHKHGWHQDSKLDKHSSTICPFCTPQLAINREGQVRLSPVGIADIDELIQVTATARGSFTSADWPVRKAKPGEAVHFWWDHPGNYTITWKPDAPDAIPVAIPVFVRRKTHNAYALTQSPSFLFDRSYGADGALESVVIVDTSYNDRPSNRVNIPYIRWSEKGMFLPLTRISRQKTGYVLAQRILQEGREVTLRVQDEEGKWLEATRELLPQASLSFPRARDNAPLFNPFQVIVGETVLCTKPAELAWKEHDAAHDSVCWTGIPVPIPQNACAIDKAFPTPGTYDVAVNLAGKTFKGSITAVNLADAAPRLLDLSPPSVQYGSEVIARDVSGQKNVVRRDIRWGRDRTFDKMQRDYAGQTYGKPGVHEVTLRLWHADGTYQEETRNVKVINDDWQIILSITPNPATIGQTITIRDESVIPPGATVKERHIRWFPSTAFHPFEGDTIQKQFPTEGFHKAVIRMLDDQGIYHYGQASVHIIPDEPASSLKKNMQ